MANRLDRDVYQIVRRYEDLQESKTKYTVSGVYDYIKRSNSSLSRQKKRPLEDTIERVLRLRKEERKEDEDEDMNDALLPASPKPKERDYFLMNKQITRSWNVTQREKATSPEKAPSGITTPAAEPMVNSDIVMADRQPNGEPKAKRKRAERRKDEEDRSPPSGPSLKDIGGMQDAIKKLTNDIAFPVLFPTIYKGKTTRGILLHGPPGCGKTMLANAFAAKLGISWLPVSAPSLVAGMSGESEKQIRQLYDEAKKLAPCLVFIDEIDAIMGKRDNAQREMEKRIVAQMLTCMDDLALEKTGGKAVITLAATNRPDSLDPALRRAGRFNSEINIGVPNEKARAQILKAITRKFDLSEDVDFELLAKMTPGFVGADLEDVVSVASSVMSKRHMGKIMLQSIPNTEINVLSGDDSDEILDTIGPDICIDALKSASEQGLYETPENELVVTQQDFVNAIPKVQPSAKREGFTTIPDTTWAQVGALHKVREELSLAIIEPIETPELFAGVGWTSPAGVLLWGPPGCGKTLLAKAVANQAKANFISVKGPELLNKYVGESERAIRQMFARARSSAPCILFFDEIDTLVPKRDLSMAEHSARVVNTMLAELDGMSDRSGVYVVGATNRPDTIDSAIRRPGRLGTNIFVGLPDADGRADILKTLIKSALPDSTEADLAELETIAKDGRCDRFSGADLESLHNTAGKEAVKRAKRERVSGARLTLADWEAALNMVKPSISHDEEQRFKRLADGNWD